MLRRTFIALVMVLALASGSHAEDAVTLTPGVSHSIRIAFSDATWAITDPEVLRIEKQPARAVDGTSLVLYPRREGMTDVWLSTPDGSHRQRFLIRVAPAEEGMIVEEVEDMLKDIPSVEVKTLGDAIVLTGQVDLPEQLMRVDRLVTRVGRHLSTDGKISLRNLVELSPSGKSELAARIEREIGSQEVTVSFVNNDVYIEGLVDNDFEGDRAVEVARTYLYPDQPLVVDTKKKDQVGQAAIPMRGLASNIKDLTRIRPLHSKKKTNP